MFKYKVSDVNLYETSYYLEELHQMFDFWENAISHPDHDYIHEVNIIFSDLESEFGGEYKNVLEICRHLHFLIKQNLIGSLVIHFDNKVSYLRKLIKFRVYEISTKPHAIIYICQPLKHELAHSLGLNYYSMNEFKNTPCGSVY